jgi:hypothetical protein
MFRNLEVLTAITIKTTVPGDMTQYSLVSSFFKLLEMG